MSTKFAERILDDMVDENGHCGDRAMSRKQFDIITGCWGMEIVEEDDDCGHWEGYYARRDFWSRTYEGVIGKYAVRVKEFHHFHGRYTVESIDLRPKEELEFEARMRELAKFEHSEWVGEEKQRMELELVLVRDYVYEKAGYSYYTPTETAHIYTFADADGNCFVWKTTKPLDYEWYDEDDRWRCIAAEVGDRVYMKATVKEHGEYKGVKQTVINRPKVSGVTKRVA